jgi:serine/threonine-protein kinase
LWQLWRQGQQPDVREFLAGLEELSLADLVAILRVDQHERWRRGEHIPAEHYLQQFFSLHDEEDHALDLVYGEFLLREQLGEAPAPQEYVQRFPQFAAAFRLQVELHRLLNAQEHSPASQEQTPPEDAGTVRDQRVIVREHTHPLPAVSGYEIVGILGRGGMGVVYKAWQVGLKRLVALKMLPAGEPGDPEQFSRFRAESEAVAQLQHPNIVQIYEVGEQDGRPFFSLELVEGGSLDKWLAGKPQAAREAAQLLQTLAQAIQAAHQRGIVHRDLKPGNVLLHPLATDEHGLTQIKKEKTDADDCSSIGVHPCSSVAHFLPKITDFGLAKQLHGEEAQTRTGAIMGTPNYMSPEQAAGRNKEISPATDIYALGAILYELLTGRPPFNGATPLETLEQVRSREPVPPRQLQPKLSPDLETICLKCLQKDPHRRYASAADLAEDLGRFLRHEPIRARPVSRPERLWRWCRRNPMVAALSLSLMLTVLTALGLTTYLYLDADYQRGEAEANAAWAKSQFDRAEVERAKAEKKSEAERQEYTRAELHLNDCYLAVDRFLTRVSEEHLLRQPDMEGLRKELLQSAVEFLNKFASYRSDIPQFESERGQAYARLASITRETDSRTKAIPLILKAQAIFETLARRQPGEPKFQDQLANTYNILGNLYHDTNQFAQAEQMLQEARSLWESLARAHPARADLQLSLAINQSSLALVWTATGKLERAEKAHRKAIELMEGVARAPDAKAPLQCSLGVAYNNLGVFLRDLSRVEEAAVAYQKAIEILERLVQKHPKILEYRDALALNHLNLGLLQRDTGRSDLAEKAYHRSAALFQALARDHPRVAIYQEGLANSHNNLGVLYRDRDTLELAEKAFLQSAEVRETLARLYPEVPDYQSRWAESQNNLAKVYAATRRLDLAEKAFQRAITQFEELVQNHPKVARYAHLLAGIHNNLGGLYVNSGKPNLAAAPFQKAADLLGPVTKDHPKVADYRNTQGLLHFNKGNWHLSQGRIDLAEGAYEKAVAVFKPLHREHPAVADYVDYLALSKRALADVYRQTQRARKAETLFKEALALREEMVDSHPGMPRYQEALAAVYNDLGTLYSSTDQPNTAEEVYRKALKIRKQLVARHPTKKEWAVGLGGVCCNLGHLALGKGQRQTALEWYDQAITTLEAVRKINPQEPDARVFLGNAYAGRAGALYQAQKFREAVSDLDEGLKLEKGPRQHNLRLLRALAQIKLGNHVAAGADADILSKVSPIAPSNLYALAALYALAHEVSLKDASLSDEDKGKVPERYAAAALKTLRRAQAAGMFDNPQIRDRVKTNPDLVSLRQRADFKTFLAELEKETEK